MAERNPDNADPTLSVDELRRKARRRLVGAVVIALAAAIVLPLLLETDPKPLGEDVAVKIPAVDDSRFVSRLSGKSGDPAGSATATAPVAPPPKAAAAPEPAPTAAAAAAPPTAAPPVAASVVPPPKKTVAEAEQRLLTPAVKAPVASPPVATQPVAKPVVPAPDPVSKPAVSAPEARTAAAPPPAPKSVDPGTAAAPAKEGFVVQLAAYADDKGANAFAARLKKAGHAAYVEPVETSRGTLWRVRVGGFATRADADVARARLKDEGHSGIVAAAK